MLGKFRGLGASSFPRSQLWNRNSTSTLASIENAKFLLLKAQAVCFDVDSTVIQDEGIDVLAAHNGAGEAVAEWTKRYASDSHRVGDSKKANDSP